MNYTLRTALRLSLRGGGSRTGIAIAVAGVALAVVVLEITLAVVTGFKQEIRRKLAGFDAQISVLAPFEAGSSEQVPYFDYTDSLQTIVRGALPAQATVAAAWRVPGILKTDTDFEGVVFEGRQPDSDFSFERSNIVRGAWPDYAADSCANQIVISEALAGRLGLDLGDRLFSTFVFDGNVRMRRHTIGALYCSDFGEYDLKVVYCSPALLRSVGGAGELAANRLDIRGLDEDLIDPAAQSLQTALLNEAAMGRLDAYFPVSSVHQSGALYYNWLALLDTNVVVIFILMLAVAGLTLISSLFILILERIRTIGILRALGSTRSEIRTIFVLLTLKVVGWGLLIGNVLGIGFLILQKNTGLVPLDPDMYYLSSVPVDINVWAIIALNVGVVAAAYLILVLPAGAAARISPAEAAKFD